MQVVDCIGIYFFCLGEKQKLEEIFVSQTVPRFPNIFINISEFTSWTELNDHILLHLIPSLEFMFQDILLLNSK